MTSRQRAPRVLATAEILGGHQAEVGEGPVWDPRIGRLIWVDGFGQVVFSTDPSDGSTEQRQLPLTAGIVLPRASGGYVAALEDGFYALPDDGAPELIAHADTEDPATRFNDGDTDPQGRLWAGTMAVDQTLDPQGRLWTHTSPDDLPPGRGALYRLDLDGTVTRMLEGVIISNGLGWSPDGTTMYYVDMPTRRVDRFDFDAASGDITNRREFTTIVEGGGLPDGLTVDSEGAVWVATWPGYGVHRYLPDGTLDAIVPLPVSNVSSCELGGPDLRDLFITTASGLLSGEERGSQPLAGSLFHTRVDVPGIPRTPFAG